jgi:hypothetical protein
MPGDVRPSDGFPKRDLAASFTFGVWRGLFSLQRGVDPSFPNALMMACNARPWLHSGFHLFGRLSHRFDNGSGCIQPLLPIVFRPVVVKR